MAERGVIKIQYIKLTLVDLQWVIIILHTWLVPCCGKAEQVEQFLSEILSPPANSPHACSREELSGPDRRTSGKNRWRELCKNTWKSWVSPYLESS